MFHILERELQWRRENGKLEGFGTLRASRPIVALGAEEPLEEQKMLADYFRTYRSLRITCSSNLHFTPQMERTVLVESILVYEAEAFFREKD